MDVFNDTHRQIRDTVERFIAQHVTPHIQDWEEAGQFPRDLYLQAGRDGILGIGHPEALGGTFEGDVLAKVAATEGLMSSTSGGLVAGLGSLDIALPPVIRWARSEVRDRVVPAVLAGEKIAALAITEPGGGSDVANLKTRAVREGDHYVVNGSKTFITSGQRADYYTVAVRTGGDGFGGISLLLIERDTPGFTRGQPLKKMGWWCSDTAELFFDNVRVPAEHLIGAENAGFPLIMANFVSERLALAVMAYRTAELALDLALDWARQREAFGRPLAKFQVQRHRLAEMATRVTAARTFTLQVATTVAAGKQPIREVCMAKNFATDVAQWVVNEAVQIFGGMGYMRDSTIERLYRDARILPIGGGTTEIMREVIAKQMGL